MNVILIQMNNGGKNMDNRYEVTANAIRQAEDALETLKRFTDIQYKAKGETMLDQIADYIADSVEARAAKGNNFGVAVIPEGVE